MSWSWSGRLNQYLSSDPIHTFSLAKALDGGEGPCSLFLQLGVQWIAGILFTSFCPRLRLRAGKAPPQTQDSSSGGSGA